MRCEDKGKRFTAMIQAALIEAEFWRSPMTAFVQAISRRLSWTETKAATGTDALTAIALVCGAALFVFLLRATYGLDLSPGFF